MFCQCYFNTKPSDQSCCPPKTGAPSKVEAGKAEPAKPERFCLFNNAYKVNSGTFGETQLDGAKFWVAGDLGGDFSKGETDWATLIFDPAVTKAQRDGIAAILAHVYPVKWRSMNVGPDAAMDWQANKDRAEARLDGGKVAQVVLKRNQGNTDDPIVIKNLKYWGVPRNDGFIMMQNEVEAYRAGDKPFEFKGTNGFMITIDMASADVKAADAGKKVGY